MQAVQKEKIGLEIHPGILQEQEIDPCIVRDNFAEVGRADTSATTSSQHRRHHV